MKHNITIILLTLAMTFYHCYKGEQRLIEPSPGHLQDGLYKGIFYRSGSSGIQSDTSQITITFSEENWKGQSSIEKYPALCQGTYAIDNDTIIFVNQCFWTAEFDWTLILSGKYKLKTDHHKVEFKRNYQPNNAPTYYDMYQLIYEN